MNYYNVASGKILIDNNRLIDYKIEHLREKIAFQSFFPRISLEFVDIDIDHEKVGGQAVLGRQLGATTPWRTERQGYGPSFKY